MTTPEYGIRADLTTPTPLYVSNVWSCPNPECRNPWHGLPKPTRGTGSRECPGSHEFE